MMRPARSTEIRLRSMDRLRSSGPCGWNGCEGRGLESRYAWRTPRGRVRQEEAVAKSKRTVWQRSTRSELVRIILAGKENDIAWETFTGGPVGTQRWLETAAVRGKTHPRDAIALYHGLLPVAAAVRATPGDEAFEIVQAIGMLRARLDEHAEFASELEGIRATYRAKRNFIKLLAKLPWNCPQAVQADSPATRPPPASGRCRRYRKMYAVVLRGVDVHPELTCHAVRLFTTSKANAR